MSYAQKPTLSEELQGRLGDALSRWARGFVFNVRLLLRPRTTEVPDAPARGARRPLARMAPPSVGTRSRGDRVVGVPPPPLP